MKTIFTPIRTLGISIFMLTILTVSNQRATAQSDQLSQTILEQDALFWKAYNGCQIDEMAGFFVDDLEFYHDKGGLTDSKTVLKEVLNTGLCGEPGSRLRREAKAGTVKVYPLDNYGAIITGEHTFFRNKTGQDEYPEESARFTHVWKFENNVWKMTRVLSYDHQPVPYENTKEEIQISAEALALFAGTFQGDQTGTVEISVAAPNLELKATQFGFTLYPQTVDTFFIKERPITFSFVTDAAGKVIKMVVKENGAVAEELKKVK
ncbi:MAG: nuclear transport factor 2 family protein [Roseivirga sp.]|nr:nuclear transport factor 2 family protein [Roseivirga sp.]